MSIGSTVDGDDGTQQNADATADDTPANKDDEDGISSFAVLETDDTSYSVDVDVTHTTGGDATLIGWIDFDRSGTFESDEAVSVDVANNATSATLTWDDTDANANNDLPDDIVAGSTFARFRLSKDGAATFNTTTPGGSANDGEVEDYQLNITQAYDYGDAPDITINTTAGDYQTTITKSDTDAPRHAITNGLNLGTNIDADDGTLQGTDTGADTDDGDGSDDEDGVTFVSTTIDTDDDNYGVTVDVTNTDNKNVTLVGWIDFDRSGTFDPDEAVSKSGILGAGETLNWSSLPDDITDGTTYARFRLSSDTDLTTSYPIGTLDDGEIEDYQAIINGIDYGDAPDTGAGTSAGNYETTNKAGTDNDGAAHTIINGLSIGNSVDPDSGTAQNAGATADDTTGTDDEDGVTFGALSIDDAGGTYTVTVDVDHTTGSTASLIGWIDFNGNGQFEDTEASTLVSNTNLDSGGEPTLTWNVPSGADIKGGTTYARIRLSDGTLTDATPNGLIGNGEVEDYQITIGGGNDFGDAAKQGGDSYATTTTSHGVVNGINIGDIVDSETSVTPNTTATTDDTTGSDDEDGVDFIKTKVISTNDDDNQYSVEVVVNSLPTETNTLASDDFSVAHVSGTDAYQGGSPNDTGNDWASVWGGFETNSVIFTGAAPDDTNSGAGAIEVQSGQLKLGDDLRGADRAIDLSGATGTVNLSFDYTTIGNVRNVANDVDLEIRISNDNRASFTQIANIDANTDPASGSVSAEIPSNLFGANTIISFGVRSTLGDLEQDDGFAIDNVEVTETVPVETNLVGWIDFDRNGTFADTEAVRLSTNAANSTDGTTALNINGSTANILTWSDVNGKTNGVTPGDTYARFRLSTDTDLDTSFATGVLDNGEIEDYRLTIKNEVTGTGAGEVIDAGFGSRTIADAELIIGGAGQDTLTGGDGDDCFHFNRTSDGIDVITDFQDNGDADKIDFSDMFATGGELEGVTNPFGTHVIALPASTTSDGTMIQVDFDGSGDSIAKSVVFLQDYDNTVTPITADDFIF